ncbi:MAG: hypothetical protein D6702_02165 [Planctomycetota bacterium]|nr:MAG: hypothetical protein D6702_02165 [Planctomycetota bacterium]
MRRLGRRGSALVVVIMALALLLSLGVPFLLAGRLRSESAREGFDRVRARIAAASASRHALARAAASHPAVDPTPWWDDPAEWAPRSDQILPRALGGGWEDGRESWGEEVEALQGRVSLASAPPLLLQNLLHPCFLRQDADYRASELIVTSTAGFPDHGLLFLANQWVEYGGRTPTSFTDVSPAPEEQTPDDLEQTRFREGTAVLDPRILNLVWARLRFGGQRPPEFAADLFELDVLGQGLLAAEERARLRELTWFAGGVYGHDAWGPGTWLLRDIDPENPERAVVADSSGFSPGSVARFLPERGDPYDALILAAGVGRGGAVLVAAGELPSDLEPFTTRVLPLLREPVDLNSARPEVIEALVTGLRWARFPPWPGGEQARRLRGRPGRDWVTPSKARAFAERVVAARPLRGPQDLWQRVLLPLETEEVLSSFEALAIHLNGLQAGSGELLQSTLPFGYRSGDRYRLRLDAAVRSRLGSTLARAAFEEQVRAAPDGPLLRLWRSQRDFAEEEQWGRGGHGVVSLPNNIGGLGGHHDPALALALRTGAWLPSGILGPEEDPDRPAGVMPRPARETDDYGPGAFGRTEHFDWEPSPLGWDVRERGPFQRYLFEWGVVGGDAVVSDDEPLHLQGWFRMPADAGDAVLFDLAGASTDANRVSAALEDGRLVVRAFDAAGDDPFDPDDRVQAVTVTVDPAEYPFLDRWLHLSVLLRGVHPRGLQVALDGTPRGEIDCLTYTLGPVAAYAPGDPDGEILVESTAGFPDRGVIRIGDEVIEYSGKTDHSFILERTAGPDGYLGGRVAREASDALIASQDSTHPPGAAVELYGYSAVLAAPLPPGGGLLSGDFGPWSLARPIGGPDAITVLSLQGRPIQVGMGIGPDWLGELELAEAVAGDPYYAEAFQSDGGFALMFQRRTGWVDGSGARLGGWEVVRYGRRQDNRVTITERNVLTPGLARAPDGMVSASGNAFVTEWNPNIVDNQGQPLQDAPRWFLYLIPISVKGQGVSDLTYPLPDPNHSEFVQITVPGDSGRTEWVRYDSIVENAFVRDDPGALLRTTLDYTTLENLPPPEGKSGAGYRPPLQDPGGDSHLFTRTIGEPVDDRDALIESLARNFQFRGVLGTFDHAQDAGARLVPVGRTLRRFGPWGGYVGRLDRVAVVDPESQAGAPFWYTVEWGAAPPPDDPEAARLHLNQTYFAFTDSPGVPYAATDLSGVDLDSPGFDPRAAVRLVKYPSGERPLGLENVVVGGDVSGGGAPFPGLVDEFAVHTVSGMGPPRNDTARGAFVLAEDLEPGEEDTLRLHEYFLQIGTERKSAGNAGDWFGLLPPSGLLDIDGERIAYTAVDPGTGEVTLAPAGRGLHGTEPRGHAAGTTVWVVDGRAATVLTADLGPTAPLIEVERLAGFPPRPLLLIDQELIHAPLRGQAANQFLMPTRRPDPERNRDGGEGILRGRFGTAPAAHPAGALVYSMPCRWEDRYIPESDSPAGAWFEIGLEEPDAYWRGVRYEAELPEAANRIVLLARTDPAGWEDPPEETPGLLRIEQGEVSGRPVPLGLRGDRLDLRFAFAWDAGAFDPVQFLSFGWLAAPRLREVLVDYLAESRVERRREVLQ